MIKALMPFWIYWGLLAAGCILFFGIPVMSLLLFLVLPMLLVIIPTWLIIVYLIGDAVSRKRNFHKVSRRIGVSLLCSFLTVMLFPVGSWIYDAVKWDKFYLNSLIGNFNDRPLWIMFAIHFLVFWIGMEIGHASWTDNRERSRPEEDNNNGDL